MKKFGLLTNEEKGLLMLAHHEEKAIQWARPDESSEWLGDVFEPRWTYDIAYRVKPVLIFNIKKILEGIDAEGLDSSDGWWETSEGAEFGKRKLAEVIREIEGYCGVQ